jgi:hypothetical protein
MGGPCHDLHDDGLVAAAAINPIDSGVVTATGIGIGDVGSDFE